MHAVKCLQAVITLCIVVLTLFSGVGASMLDISGSNVHGQTGEEAWEHLTSVSRRGSLSITNARGGVEHPVKFRTGFNMALLSPKPSMRLPGPKLELMIGREYEPGKWAREEFSMTEPPEPKPLSPSPGDWVVSSTEVREDEVIILTGNLIVESGGNLTLINCTLYMNCTYDGEWQIRVESGGIMNVLEGSNITAYNPDCRFLFYVYGRLIMRGSELHECGRPGLRLQTDEGVVIENCKISNCHHGVYCYNSSNITVANCTISWNNYEGICCSCSSGVVVSGCNISQNWNGISCWCSSGITISGCNISQNGNAAVHCEYSSNITIIDCEVVGGEDGIGFWDSSSVIIGGCKVSYIEWSGIYCSHSLNVTITSCEVSRSGNGICCGDSLSIVITGCNISQNEYLGIYCDCSSNVTISGCTLIRDGVILDGYQLSHFASHVIENNTVNGKPLYYIVNITGPYDVPSDVGQAIIVNSMHVRLTNANLSYTDVGLEIIYSSNITISSCGINRDLCGIYCYHSSNATIISCDISQNDDNGILCLNSSNITIMNCRINQNFYWGIGCDSGVTIISCEISQNYWDGIYCLSSSNITITNCRINYNGVGIVCHYTYVGIMITDCDISRNRMYGVFCKNSSGVAVHYCNIYGNERHGLYIRGEYVVNASYNWWGSPDGPEYKHEGDPEDPEEVYSYYGPEYLIYEPWLTEPIVIDTIPPSVEILSPESGSYVKGTTTISVDACDNETGIDRVEFYINGTLTFTDFDHPYEYAWNTTEYPDGVYTIEAVAYDKAGNTAEQEVVVVVDNTEPTIGEPTISPEAPTEEDDVTVKVSVTDALSGLREVILSYSTDGGATWTNITMTLSPEGYYMATIPRQPTGTTVSYKIYACDIAGNWARSPTYSYTVKAKPAPIAIYLAIGIAVAAVVGVAAWLIRRRYG